MMKPILKTLAVLCLGLGSLNFALAEDKHDHDHDHDEPIAGPNGGKVFTSVEPHLEFFVTKDRKVQITALNEENKPAAIGEQSVRVTGGDRTSPTRMSFAKEGEVLLSDNAFPEGNDFPVVVQIKTGPDAETVTEKFNLNLKDCPTCDYKEYACICEHSHDHDEHEHEHKEDKKG